jgi:hypothetical protein
VAASDTGESIALGDPTYAPACELVGPGHRLSAVFAGFASLSTELRSSRLGMIAAAADTATLARASLAWKLGDPPPAGERR